MLHAGVVHHQIQDDADALFRAGGSQGIKILQGAERRGHGVIIRHVVMMIAGRRMDGRQPDVFCAQGGNIIQLPFHALQIAHAVAVAVRKGAHENLVHDAAAAFRRQAAPGQKQQAKQRQGDPSPG